MSVIRAQEDFICVVSQASINVEIHWLALKFAPPCRMIIVQMQLHATTTSFSSRLSSLLPGHLPYIYIRALFVIKNIRSKWPCGVGKFQWWAGGRAGDQRSGDATNQTQQQQQAEAHIQADLKFNIIALVSRASSEQ